MDLKFGICFDESCRFGVMGGMIVKVDLSVGFCFRRSTNRLEEACRTGLINGIAGNLPTKQSLWKRSLETLRNGTRTSLDGLSNVGLNLVA